MKLIAGLGNPGPQYARTRHNLGFMAVERLAGELGAAFDREKHQGLIAEARLGAEKLLLVKPLTYMNRSGDCIAAVARNRVHAPQDILVVVDDVALPLGRLRIRGGGSAGGHNGLKSIIERLGSPDFHRMRMGVGSKEPGQDLADHVLSKFRPDEWPEVETLVGRGVEAIRCWVEAGLDTAMNRFNA